MASIASSGTSPILGYDPFLTSDSNAETEESWAFINFSSSGGASAASAAAAATTTPHNSGYPAPATTPAPPPSTSSISGFEPSPASRGSMSSYAVLSPYQHVSPAELSSGSIAGLEHHSSFVPPQPQTQPQPPSSSSSSSAAAFLSEVHHAQLSLPSPSLRGGNEPLGFGDGIDQNVVQMQSSATGILDGTEMFFASDLDLGVGSGLAQTFLETRGTFLGHEGYEYMPSFQNNSSTFSAPQAALHTQGLEPQSRLSQVPLYTTQHTAQVPTAASIHSSWHVLNEQVSDPFILETFDHTSGTSISSGASDLSLSPVIKTEQQLGNTNNSPTGLKPTPAIPIAIRKVRGAGARIEKKKATAAVAANSFSDSEHSPNNSRFVIVTPRSITAQAGKPNPYECFEAMRPSQKGRKGPLATQTKENALQVRRVGACFCCHARKVKCDTERPCRNCKKLCAQVPQVVCWQFQDFITVLFPDFVRAHFRRDEMSRFMAEHVASYNLSGGMDGSCAVELYSGPRFSATLNINAQFFTARTDEVLSHWHFQVGMANGTNLAALQALPIGLGPELTNPQKEEVRKKLKEYIGKIVQEPAFAEQATEYLNISSLPRRILQIVHNYAEHSDSTMVKRALSIYAMHYVMTRHLTLTRKSINTLQSQHFGSMVPQNAPWVTPRVLNRQLKAMLDEHMTREVQHLFDMFSKSLKPKSKREWAPCLAAFLVLCLFMEAIETAADMFATSENEVDRRKGCAATYKRSFAAGITKEIEGLPFKQFAYQFHQVYQTHSKEPNAKSYNPLVDEGIAEMGELDIAAMEMVLSLKQILKDDWAELDFFGADAMLPSDEHDLFPRSVAHDYSTRLLSKFLLSFTDESHIFGQAT